MTRPVVHRSRRGWWCIRRLLEKGGDAPCCVLFLAPPAAASPLCSQLSSLGVPSPAPPIIVGRRLVLAVASAAGGPRSNQKIPSHSQEAALMVFSFPYFRPSPLAPTLLDTQIKRCLPAGAA